MGGPAVEGSEGPAMVSGTDDGAWEVFRSGLLKARK